MRYEKDGKTITCEAIFNKGRVGQVVINEEVNWGGKSEVKPLSMYPHHHPFTIVEITGELKYTLRDAEGKLVHTRETDAAYLYDAKEWLEWQTGFAQEQLAEKDRLIKRLQDHLDLLKDILVRQGNNVIALVTKENAEKAGLITPK